MEENNRKVDELKIKIRSVLLSSKQGIKKSDFLGEYTQLTGEGINVKQLGYKNIADLMTSIPDTVVVGRGDSYTAVSTESTEHLEKLIQRQKPANNKSRRTGYPRRDDARRPPPFRKYGRSSGPHVVVHKKSIAPGRLYKKHVSSPSGPSMHGRYPYNTNKFKSPSNMPMGVSRLPWKKSPPVNNTTTTSPNSVKMKVLSILHQATDGLHVSVLQKKFRSQTGTNIPFVEYGYNSIGDLMSGFMWNNFKCIHSGDFYFAVRSSSGTSNNRSIHNNNDVGSNRQPARNGSMLGSSSCSNTTTTSAHFNNKHRPLPYKDSSDKRNMLLQSSSETNGVMQNRRFFNPNERPNNRNIHRNKKQTANNRGKQAISSIDDYDDQEERFINNHHQSFDDSSYGEPDSPTTTSSSHHHQRPPHHRLSRSDITRSELPSDASSSSEYLPTASGSFKKNLKSEANNKPRNRSYSTNSNNSGGVGSSGSQPLEDFDYDSPRDEQPMSFPLSGEPQMFKNSFDSISAGLRFKKGRGCGRGYGLSSYIGETSPEGPRHSERSVALPDNWNSSEKLTFQNGSGPVENLIISIRNTSISDDKPKPAALDMMGRGLGRGRGRTRNT